MISNNLEQLKFEIQNSQKRLSEHPLYNAINSQENLRIFMESHVLAVWDFMTLLKALQNRITYMQIPWRPSSYDKRLVQIINELVLNEESDTDYFGKPNDHFTMYSNAMVEVGADVSRILKFMFTLDSSILSPAQKDFVEYSLKIAKTGTDEEVAGAFFYGREALIPLMFTGLLKSLNAIFKDELNLNKRYPNFIYYFERHIEIDGGSHRDLAENFLSSIAGTDYIKNERALISGLHSLKLREALWTETHNKIKSK